VPRAAERASNGAMDGFYTVLGILAVGLVLAMIL
jgi:hypothetical protein